MVSGRDTIRLVVVATLGTLVAIMSTIIIATIGARSGKETRTGIIKDTGRAGESLTLGPLGGTSAQVWIQELPRQDCGPDEVGVWLPINRTAAEWRCIAKEAVK